MSATLTPERKSAQDRPGVGHKVGDCRGRERGGKVASTEVLVVRKPAIGFGSRPVRAVPDPYASRAPPGRLLHLADVLAVDALAAHVAAVACMRSTSLAAALARAVADPPLSAALSLSLLLLSLARAPPLLHHWHMYLPGTCVARAHACVR